MVKITCGECNGTGEVDSGGMQPWGEWIEITCPTCLGYKEFDMTTCRFMGECCIGVDIYFDEIRKIYFAIDSDMLVLVGEEHLRLCDHISRHYANCYH